MLFPFLLKLMLSPISSSIIDVLLDCIKCTCKHDLFDNIVSVKSGWGRMSITKPGG